MSKKQKITRMIKVNTTQNLLSAYRQKSSRAKINCHKNKFNQLLINKLNVMETKTTSKNGLGSKKDLKIGANSITPKRDKEVIKETRKVSSKTTPIVDKTTVETVKVEKVETPIIPIIVEKPALTLDQKIEKIENLKTLIEKREKLEASRKKLNAFVVGTNNFNESIKLTDENGNVFQTSNTEVFSKVISTINETLIEKIREIETQINF